MNWKHKKNNTPVLLAVLASLRLIYSFPFGVNKQKSSSSQVTNRGKNSPYLFWEWVMVIKYANNQTMRHYEFSLKVLNETEQHLVQP